RRTAPQQRVRQVGCVVTGGRDGVRLRARSGLTTPGRRRESPIPPPVGLRASTDATPDVSDLRCGHDLGPSRGMGRAPTMPGAVRAAPDGGAAMPRDAT